MQSFHLNLPAGQAGQTKTMDLTKKANETIANLKRQFTNDRFILDLNVSVMLAGEHNKLLRQEVIRLATNVTKPLTQCTLPAVSNALMAHFQQPQLF